MRRLPAAALFVAVAAGTAALPVSPVEAAQKKKKAAPPAEAGPDLGTPWSFAASAPLPLPKGTTGVWASAGTVADNRLKPPTDAGVVWVRAATAGGVSPPRPASTDPLPAVAEEASNRSRETPQTLPVPCVVAGRADAEARAFFRIPVTKGTPLTVEVLARRLGSPLDPVVVLFHPDGRTIPGAYADDTPGLMGDCRVRWTPPADGFVVAEVRDSTYKGGPEFTYRLRVGDLPGATTAYPLVAQRGTRTRVGFSGPHAGGAPDVRLKLPSDGWRDAVPVAPGGGWPVWLTLSDDPQTAEAEPNDTPATATPVAVPGGASARFAAAKDVDQFRFRVTKGRKYVVVARTFELNSPAEVYLRVRDASGKSLGESDPTAAACKVEFTAVADGPCFAVCEHQNYLHGPAEVYHLSVRPAGPDFAVTLPADRLSVPVGGVGVLTPKVDRTGYDGPITLSVEGDGFAGSGPADGSLGVTCTRTEPGIGTLRLKATATLDGAEVVRWASVAEPVRAGLNGLPTVPPELARTVAVAVRPAAPFGLTTAVRELTVTAGGTIELTVTVARRDGFEEPVVLTLANPPAGLSAKPLTAPAEAGNVKLSLTAAGDAASGGLVVKGTAGGAEVFALPVRLTVTAPPKPAEKKAKPK